MGFMRAEDALAAAASRHDCVDTMGRARRVAGGVEYDLGLLSCDVGFAADAAASMPRGFGVSVREDGPLGLVAEIYEADRYGNRT